LFQSLYLRQPDEIGELAWQVGRARLRPEPGKPVVVKQYASAFFGTSLASTLHAAAVDTVVLAGVSISGCQRPAPWTR
jgi:nicotinamidase-related amidase